MSVAVCKYVPSVLTLRWVAFFRLFIFALGCDRDAYNLHVLLICDSRLASCDQNRNKTNEFKSAHIQYLVQ